MCLSFYGFAIRFAIPGATKSGPFLRICNSCLWWRKKGDLYSKQFTTLSRVRLFGLIFVTLNILCTSLIIILTLKITIHPLFTAQLCYGHFTCSAAYRNPSQRSDLQIKMLSTVSEVRAVLNFTAARYSLHKCSDWIPLEWALHVTVNHDEWRRRVQLTVGSKTTEGLKVRTRKKIRTLDRRTHNIVMKPIARATVFL